MRLHDPEDAATVAALKRISADGSDMSRAMEIDFFVAVSDEKSGLAVAERAASAGFKTKVKSNATSSAWTCYCTKSVVPSYANVRAIEHELDAIARSYGGHADGFGSYGNANNSN